MKTHALFIRTLATAFLTCVLVSCSQQNDQTSNRVTETPGTPLSIKSGEVTLEIFNVEQLDSYQTHYIMNYPPEGEQFLRIETNINGADNPEAWSQRSLTVGSENQRFTPVHVRRVLIGDDYEYTSDEDFVFRYQIFFSLPESLDLSRLDLFVETNQALPIEKLYAHSNTGIPATQSAADGEPAPGEFSVVSGGSSNFALATHTTVSGGQYNAATVAYATVGGGRENQAEYLYTTIGGGYGNLASGRESTIAGGSRNTAAGDHAAISGGIRNRATATDAVVAGGAYNLAEEVYTTIGGGTRNQASGTAAVVSGGAGNHSIGEHSSITGGLGNQASGSYSSILGGHQNNASGRYSVILGGLSNQAAGNFSTAVGHGSQVSVEHPGTFLYADSLDSPFKSLRADEFAIRATGGVRMVSAVDPQGEPIAGVILPPGSGSWETLSSQNSKSNLQLVQTDQILASLMEMPVYTWTYRTDPGGALHIGPVAEDFYSQFSLGNYPSSIASVDADGVALAAIQETAHLIDMQQLMLSSQADRLSELEVEQDRLKVVNVRLQILNALLMLISSLFILKSAKAYLQSILSVT